MHRAIVLVLLFAFAGVMAAQDPNLQRGFTPGKMYDLLGLDNVNTFNGNLNLRIPLGQTYTAGPVLRYQFVLAYNSKLWEFDYLQGQLPPGQPRKIPVPDTRSTAGFGWRLSLGDLYAPVAEALMPPSSGWTYVAPDGSSHQFNSTADDPTVAYTKDGSFLRLRRVPEDTSQTIQSREIDFPDGTIHTFDDGGRLKKIRDRYGNWIKVDYPTNYKWEVKDGYGDTPARTHTIDLIDGVNVRGAPYNQANFRFLPSKLKLATTAGTIGTYELTYTHEELPVGHCAGNLAELPNALVPLLTSIKQPDGTTFTPLYQMTEAAKCTSGVITELALPTRGKIEWLHGLYELSFQECVKPDESLYTDSGWFGSYAGVTQRILKNEAGDVVETRSYSPALVKRPPSEFKYQKCGDTQPNHYLMFPPEEFRNTVTVTVPEGGTTKTIEKTTHYFSAFPAMGNVESTPTSPMTLFANPYDYGLPFTRRRSNGGRFLSSEVYSCSSGSCASDVVRTTFLEYAYETGASFDYIVAEDPRVKAQRTVFDSDACDASLCRYFTDKAHDRYDGYGHYRETTYGGNLGGTARTVKTEYTPDPGAWLLNTYSETSVVENSQTRQRSTYAWDAAGAMKKQRVLKEVSASTAGAGDLLSATCRDTRGFVTADKWFGGDGVTLSDSVDLCARTPAATREYAVEHEYPSGDGFRSWHKAKYRGTSSYIVDEELDSNTGNAKKTRDSAGLETTYTYDVMGRLKTISPPGAAATTFTYRNASSADTARVTSTTGSAVTMEQTYDYDGVGRLFREKRRMPDGSWALRKTDYRGAGETKFVSEWVSLADGVNENLVSPTIGTTFERDQFGRTTKITSPDDKITTTQYVNNGVRQLQRTQKIATPLNSDTSVTVTETYDMYGKLASASEPSGPTTAAAPNGGTVLTEYEYDSGGKLVEVTMNPAGGGTAQVRTFHYDTRGLLTEEMHPEKNAPAKYESFDARGHAWSITDADVALSYVYDKAERLTKVSNAAGSVLKEFTFGTSGDCTYCEGKLRKAVRHNNLPGLGDHPVTETYTYGANGLPSKRETLVERPGSVQMQRFEQDFVYDEFLALDRVDYPKCFLQGCSTTDGLTNVDHTRMRGLLTSVAGFAGSIEYHSSGMVKKVQHATAPVATDTYDADSNMARPSKITFSGTTACAVPAAPVISASTYVCAGSAGNAASVSNAENGVVYTWTIVNGTLASTSGTTVTFTAGASGQVTLGVKAANDCGVTDGAPKTLTIPQAIVTGGATINAGGSAYVDVTLTGTPPWTLTWSDGVVSSNITTSPFRRLVSPSVTTTYQLNAANGASCSLVRSGSATITVRPAAPGWMTAQATNRSVALTWPQVSVPAGARYDVERASNVDGPWTTVTSGLTQTSWNDTAPADPNGARIAYVYRVHTVAPDGTRSPVESSPRDYAVTATTIYPSGGITAFVTVVQAQQIVELRRGIDALRKLVNLPEEFTSAAPPSGWVTAASFTALLAPLDAARAKFGYPSFIYGNGIPRPAVGGVVIKAEHITQLREVLQ